MDQRKRLGFSEKHRKHLLEEIMNKKNDWDHATAASMVEVTRKKNSDSNK